MRQLEGYKFRRQVPLGPFIVDFLCLEANLVIELDGGQHVEAAGYDRNRTSYLQEQGFRVFRFWNGEVLQRTDEPRNRRADGNKPCKVLKMNGVRS